MVVGHGWGSTCQVEGATCSKTPGQPAFKFWPCHSVNSSNSDWSFFLKHCSEGTFIFFFLLKKACDEGYHMQWNLSWTPAKETLSVWVIKLAESLLTPPTHPPSPDTQDKSPLCSFHTRVNFWRMGLGSPLYTWFSNYLRWRTRFLKILLWPDDFIKYNKNKLLGKWSYTLRSQLY